MEKTTQDLFTSQNEYDTLSPDVILETLEDLEIMSRYHNENTIYLYCTLEQNVAETIIQTGQFPPSLHLYETPVISKAFSNNIAHPKTLRIALNQNINNGEVYYDQLTMEDTVIKKKFKVSIENYKSKSVYIRELVQSSNSKQKVIRYTVNDTRKFYINPQYV